MFKIKTFIAGSFVACALLSLTACSSILNSSQTQDTAYFAPTYNNGAIIALRSTLGPESDPFSGRATYSYLISINEQSSAETEIFQVSFSGAVQLAVSSSRSHIAVLEYNSSSSESIYSVETHTPESYANSKAAFSSFKLSGTATATAICFSPDETKLAISFGKEKFIVTNLQGSVLKEITSGGSFIWKNNNEGFYYKRDSDKLALINLDSDTISLYDADIEPMTYNSIEATIYSLAGNTLETYTLGGSGTQKTQLAFDTSRYAHPQISADGQKVLLTSTPYILPNSTEYLWGGVYLLDVAANKLRTLKYYSNEQIVSTN